MNLHALLLLTVVATIMIAVGLTVMFVSVQSRLYALEKELKAHKAEITNHKRDIKVIKERAAAHSDKVVIVHEYDESKAPSYPSKEGL